MRNNGLASIIPDGRMLGAPTAAKYNSDSRRRGGRVVECIGLENRQRGNPFAGSNPAPSAFQSSSSTAPHHSVRVTTRHHAYPSSIRPSALSSLDIRYPSPILHRPDPSGQALPAPHTTMNDADPIIPDASPTDESLAQTGCRLFRRSQISHLDRPVPWLWHGYVSRCQMTLLTGQWKIGKTTLLAALLARLGSGGTLAGRPVHPGRAVVITEEGAALWLKRLARHNIGEWVSFAFNPFIRKPLPRQWQYLLDDLSDLNRRLPIDLIVFDPLVAVLAGQEESSATAMTDALRPLRRVGGPRPGGVDPASSAQGPVAGRPGVAGNGCLAGVRGFPAGDALARPRVGGESPATVGGLVAA